MNIKRTLSSAYSILFGCCIVTLAGGFMWAQQAQENAPKEITSFDQESAVEAAEALTSFDQESAVDATESATAVNSAILWLRIAEADSAAKSTVLGVNIRPSDSTLQKHLALNEGVGLVVEHVSPGSAADQAGLEVHDVLHKFNDQFLINNAQLRALVKMHSPGDEVKLAIIRSGKPTDVIATLQAGPAQSNVELLNSNLLNYHSHTFQHNSKDPRMSKCSNCHQMASDATRVN